MKTLIKLRLFVLAAVFFGFTAIPAMAADFTFNVPLRIEKVPSVETVEVSCLVSRVRLGEPYAAGRGNVVARGKKSVSVTGGRFNGMVTVTMNAVGINPASSAKSYICNIRAIGRATTGSKYSAAPGNMEEVYNRATGHTLERTTKRVKGNF